MIWYIYTLWSISHNQAKEHIHHLPGLLFVGGDPYLFVHLHLSQQKNQK